MSREYCEPCGDRAWVPVYVTRKVLRYVGFFGNDIKPATHKWRLNGDREEATVEVLEAEPCPHCNPKLYEAHLQGRLRDAMKARGKPKTDEEKRAKNIARTKERYEL